MTRARKQVARQDRLEFAETEALEIIASLCETFPGLVDGETEVNGSYLIQELTAHIEDSTIPEYLKRGGK